MTHSIQPTAALTARQRASVESAAAKIRAGQPVTREEATAVEKRNTVRSQTSFIDVGRAVPFRMLEQISGLGRKELRAFGERYGLSISGRAVDLWAVLARVFGGETPAVVATYGELAGALGLACADPERTLKSYVARGMPGKPGRPGPNGGGRFDVEECRLWIAANVKVGGEDPNASGDVRAARERLVLLDLEIKEEERLEQLRRLADVDEVGRFNEQCANNAAAILEAIPDEVLATLPENLAEEVRGAIHRKVEKLVDNAREEIARQIEGDNDPTEDLDDDAPGDAASPETDGGRVAAPDAS